MARPEPWRLDQSAYPFTIVVPTRWADLDTLGHINNVSMAGLFEEGRGRFSQSLGLHRRLPGQRWLVAAINVNYLAEAHHPNDVIIASGIGHIGTTSWTVVSGAFQNGKCVATCDTVFVYTDESGAIPLPPNFPEKFDSMRVNG
jgi:acyl-CoA thioester hydrolase